MNLITNRSECKAKAVVAAGAVPTITGPVAAATAETVAMLETKAFFLPQM